MKTTIVMVLIIGMASIAQAGVTLIAKTLRKLHGPGRGY